MLIAPQRSNPTITPYREAQRRGLERPRLPLVIPLRDYAKAVSVESLFSEFFFRKHEIPIPGYSAFEQLNRMGKLLLIFDGFDEMAARVDRQQMINNFWELAKVVVPGAKVILTCRTEHFPEAKEGRALLNAELQASTKDLTGETPQFEVLELEKFNDEQIREVLSHQAQPATVEQIMGNPELLDLARRPVLTELILEALPDIEAGKPVDMSRVYLYAVRHKMERDIKAERTFTSMADKLYFMCELSWEMLSTDRMSINYREFPDRIRKLFGPAVEEEKDLDHWHYDMMGQTMLIRNAEGDYAPAHRSLLEFFVAYKFTAEIGCLAGDFIEVIQSDITPDSKTKIKPKWSDYQKIRKQDLSSSQLIEFSSEDIEVIETTFGKGILAKAVIELIAPILTSHKETKNRLLELVISSKGKHLEEVGYTSGNAITLLSRLDPYFFEAKDISHCILKGADFTNASLRWTNFKGSYMMDCIFMDAMGSILSLSFNRHRNLLAGGDRNGFIHIWDGENLTKKLTIKACTSKVSSVYFKTDGSLILSGDDNNSIKLWGVDTGQCIRTLTGHSDIVSSVTFSTNNKLIASGSDDHTIRIWDADTSECISIMTGHSDAISYVSFSHDSLKIVSGSEDHTIKVWDSTTGNCVTTLRGHSDTVSVVIFGPNDHTVISGSYDKTIKVWDVENNKCLKTLTGSEHWVRSLALSSEGDLLVSGNSDLTVRLWDLNKSECLRIYKGHKDWVRAVAFNSNEKAIFSGSYDQTIKSWNIEVDQCINTLHGYVNWTNNVNFSPDQKFIVSGSNDGAIRLWDLGTEKCCKLLLGHKNWVLSTAFSQSGEMIASGSRDKTVRLWNVKSGECVNVLRGHDSWIYSVVFSPQQNIVATSSVDKTVRLWSISTGHCIQVLDGHHSIVRAAAFNNTGEIIASASHDATVRLWNVSTGKLLGILQGHNAAVRSVSFHNSDNIIVTGSSDKTIKIWNSKSGQLIRTLKNHNGELRSTLFSPNGLVLASASADGEIRFWDVLEDYRCYATLNGHSNQIRSLAFSSDDNFIASSGGDEMIKVWDVHSGKCVKIINNQIYAGMNITKTKGITLTEKSSLQALGAFDENNQANKNSVIRQV